MFDIGFSELLLIFIVGLVVLGPKRLPVAIRTVMGWVRTIRGLAANVQNELAQELKLQELQESIKKAENLNLKNLSPDLAKTVEELKASAEKMKADLDKAAAETNTTIDEQIQILREENAQTQSNDVATSDTVEKSIADEFSIKNDENPTALSSVVSSVDSIQNGQSDLELDAQAEVDRQLAAMMDKYAPPDDVAENPISTEKTS
ncbi:Sec-independent protein translocase protein TatB [[Mannheimia] succiniciproducens]|uniref:Sec-independent protein translocase protein TatB n=1 Tax=Mannheimia succiniciproducens (strain KCTC 0769BP / MBEL55E) TaxID=221988 RepID=TATB_MANSM|nr:Sec-independent protein translocase protein TatB [[Mannheimia] succiniciproducens]Q65VA2.1 RecName: Full=Sec-independent protein translocase protein TatB [[Mannheimia] succiniciproducens MBEL55E]AAU37108.1 TatA protein [[Mannheimia] succiniciproducens MBEL55E]